MREKIRRVFLYVLLAALLSGAVQAEAYQKKYSTTVMIYMCGSDLESRLGSASRDLAEIIGSGFDPRYTRVVVMTGGAKKWKIGSGNTSILEIGGHGARTVRGGDEAVNMADGAALESFLDFVYANYDSERYALIFWDHGGGPNEGVCYDELFPGQFLSLPEIRDAVGNAYYEHQRKPDWIGFDACLMANLETCLYLEGFTDYMIASQAEEPSSGWDYSFLRGLETDAGPEDTGRRIVDAFCEGAVSGDQVRTLSCIDLRGIGKVRKAMDDFFGKLNPLLSYDTYSGYARLRHQAEGFGRAEYDASSDYDLVDLYSLAEAYGSETIPGDLLKDAVESAVVHSGSTEKNAHGLSVYHPFYNREGYADSWAGSAGSRTEKLVPENYVQYVRQFGRILTGNQLCGWSGLTTERSEGEDGEITLSLTLTEEQARYFDHASLLVLERTFTRNDGLDSTYSSVWESVPLRTDENRTVSASYADRAVYAVDSDTGEVLAGPVDFTVREDGKLEIFVDYDGIDLFLAENMLSVKYICDLDRETGEITIDHICAFDDLTGNYSERMTLDEDFFRENSFRNVVFIGSSRSLPSSGEMPGFDEWVSEQGFWYEYFELPRNWHFETVGGESERELMYACFQVTDTQNMTHSSTVCPLFPDFLKQYDPVVTDGWDPDDGSGVTASAWYLTDLDIAFIQVGFENSPDPDLRCCAENVVLNGSVQTDESFYGKIGEPVSIRIDDRLADLNEIRSVDFDLEISDLQYTNTAADHIRLEFPDPIRLERDRQEIFASAGSSDGLEWKLLGIRTDLNGNLILNLEIANRSDTPQEIHLDGIALESYFTDVYNTLSIGPGLSVGTVIYVTPRETDGSDLITKTVFDHPLAALGIESMSSLRIFYSDASGYPYIPHEVRLKLEQPYRFEETPVTEREPLAELADCGDTRILLQQVTTFRNDRYERDTLSIGMWVYNTGGESRSYYFDFYALDGERIRNGLDSFDTTNEYTVPAQTVRFCWLQVLLPSGIEKPETVSFDAFAGEDYLQRISIGLNGLL